MAERSWPATSDAASLTLEEFAARESVRAVLGRLDGLSARSRDASAVIDRLHELAGPPSGRRFAVLDLLLREYACEPTTQWCFRRRSG